MTRRHYRVIAEVLEQYRPMSGAMPRYEFRQMVRTLATEFGKDNPAFDRARFLEAVGYDAHLDDTPALRHHES